jgi:phage-related protein
VWATLCSWRKKTVVTLLRRLSGFGDAGVIEMVQDFDTDTYRAVYTVRFGDALCVLHCFPKKSRRGISTPKRDLDLIRARLAVARADHERRGRVETND